MSHVPHELSEEFPEFKRYQDTEDGIAPRAFPGTENAQYILVGAEHDEESHSLSGNRCGLPSSWEIREKMIARRYRKVELLREEMQAPKSYGAEEASLTLICWGSTEGAVQEVTDRLNQQGARVNMLSFSDLYPLPVEKIEPFLDAINTAVMIEVNYSGQLEQLLYQHTGWKPDHHIHPLTGETPTATTLLRELQDLELEELP